MLAPQDSGASGLGLLGPSTLRASPLARGYGCRGLWMPGRDQYGVAVSTAGTVPTVLDLSGLAYHAQFYTNSGPATPTINAAGEAATFSGSQVVYGSGYDGLKPASDASGFVPATLVAVVRPTTDPADSRCIFQIHSTDSSGAARIGLFRGASQSFVLDLTMDGVNFPKITVTGLAANDIYGVVGTTRSKTDHQIVVCNLRTGDITSATGSTNAGTATINPSRVVFGAYMWGVSENNVAVPYTGDINLAAALAFGATDEEMRALARAPFALVEAEPFAPAINSVVAVASMRGARIISSGYWAA